jgi:ABC-2 type transport system permease protein
MNAPATTPISTTPRSAPPSTATPFSATLRAEAIKFAAVPRRWLTVVACVLAGLVVAVVLLVSLPVTEGVSVATIAEPRDVLTAAILGVDAAAVGVVLLAAGAGGTEHRTGAAATTYLLTPRRGRVVLARTAVLAVVGAVVGVVTALATLGLGQLALVLAGRGPVPVDGALVQLAFGSAVTPLFYGLVALSGALLLRSVAGGVACALGLLAMPTLVSWVLPGLDGIVAVLPMSALHVLAGIAEPGTPEDLPVLVAVLSLLVWTTLVVLLAAQRVVRRDV